MSPVAKPGSGPTGGTQGSAGPTAAADALAIADALATADGKTVIDAQALADATALAAAVAAAPARVLVVDDDPAARDLLGAAVRSLDAEVVAVGTAAEARRALAKGPPVDVLVVDARLPDGDGLALLAPLRKRNPAARAVVVAKAPDVAGATAALRAGAFDFVPKPFAADQIAGRVRAAVDASAEASGAADRADRKLRKLKSAVRRLNDARKTISQKVDILCNDLVSAYGELSKQLDVVRTQEGFRKTIAKSKDLEGLICQAMDWLMRQTGYANIAVWLAGEDGTPQLGAYMKYTIPGDDRVSDALRRAVLPLAARDGRDAPVRASVADLKDKLTPKEQQLFKDQQFLTIDCTYLGESLATLVFFRDVQVPFGEQDAETLKVVGPVFAAALATIVRGSAAEDESDGDGDGGGGDGPGDGPTTRGPDPLGPDAAGDPGPDDGHGGGGGTANPKRRRPTKPDPADWWKRGEAPPF